MWHILGNYEQLRFSLTSAVVERPPSAAVVVESQHSRKIGPGVAAATCGRAGGTLLLYDKKVTPHFRADGHSWAKKRNGVSIKESHEKLRVNSEFVLSCCYSRGADDGRFRVRKATSNAARFRTA